MTKQTKNATADASTTAPVATPAVKAPKTAKSVEPKATAPATAPAPATATAKSVEPKAAKAAKSVEPKVVVDKSAEPKVAAVKPAKAAKPATVKAVVATPVVAEAVAAAIDAPAPSVTIDFSEFMTKLQQLSTVISSLKSEFRSLEKKASRELKTAAKASHKRKRKTGNRSPSGFVKPTLISDELASFLGKTKGTEMARTEVTREINAYIRANQLQDKTNGRRINADTKLSSLLKLASGEELTYFNLQKYMSPHFAKSSAASVAAA